MATNADERRRIDTTHAPWARRFRQTRHVRVALAWCILMTANLPATACTSTRPQAHPAQAQAEGDVEALRSATRPFTDLATAVAAGYAAEVKDCIVHEHHGAMGYHHINRSYIEKTISPDRPQILLYERLASGEYRLNGAEFIIPFRLWPRDSVAPVFLGQRMKPEDTLMYWYLHVWAWKENPEGLFSDFHPSVRCDESSRKVYRPNPG